VKNRFSRRLGKPVASIQTAIELKPNALELNFLHKNVDRDLNFAMMIKKVDIFLMGGTTGRKQWISFFCGSSHFSASQDPRTPPKLQNRCIWVSYNIPPNFKPKCWQEIFFF